METEPSFLRRHYKKLIALLVVLGVAGLMVRGKLAPKPVVVTPIERGTVVDAVYATGTVEARDRVVVKAKTNGSIAEIVVKEGAVVKRGDLLARIDNPIASFELKRGQADFTAARKQATAAPSVAALVSQEKALAAELDLAQKSLERLTGLFQSGAIARAELDVAEARAAQLKAQIGANKSQQQAVSIDLLANRDRQAAMVESLEARVADTEVRAPQDGVVLARLVELGELVAPNQPLFRVGDTADLVLEVMIDEADIARVSDGADGRPASSAAVSLYAYPKQTFKGKVFEINPEATRDRKAFLTKIRLDQNPPGLRSGMTVEANVIGGRKEGVLLAPGEAEAGGEVWLVQGGRVTRRRVEIGTRDLLRFEVKSGLDEGAFVVVEGQAALSEGARVTTSERKMDPQAPVPDQTQPSPATL